MSASTTSAQITMITIAPTTSRFHCRSRYRFHAAASYHQRPPPACTNTPRELMRENMKLGSTPISLRALAPLAEVAPASRKRSTKSRWRFMMMRTPLMPRLYLALCFGGKVGDGELQSGD